MSTPKMFCENCFINILFGFSVLILHYIKKRKEDEKNECNGVKSGNKRGSVWKI